MTQIQPGGGWWVASDGEWYPPRWEYHRETFSTLLKSGGNAMDTTLAELGKSGWELVAMVSASQSVVTGIFKRPLR